MSTEVIGEAEEPEIPIREQLLVFAEELSHLYREERARSREVEQAYEELAASHLATIRTLSHVLEAKDQGTRRHIERTQIYGVELARSIDPDLVEDPEVGFGFLLHDIGKVGIPESILAKPGALDDGEWEVMRTHPVLGAQIVGPMWFLGGAIEIIRHHHERFDGRGYPGGLRGDAIPLAARIFAVVDSFDAMTSDRPYRVAMSVDRAMDELERGRGTQFDPDVVRAFEDLVVAHSWV